MYKPIQIAEILYHYRNGEKINPKDLESYRNASKKWRDSVTQLLVGRVSTSSQKYQDNVFDANAVPPGILSELAKINNKGKGVVENYIYHRLKERLEMVSEASVWLHEITEKNFSLLDFLNMFKQQPGLRRSIDKAFEICVYALFSTIVRALKVQIKLSIQNKDTRILREFKDFITMVIGQITEGEDLVIPAKLYRVGVTNAADGGLDMWSNFGPVIQVKHVSLSENLAEDVVDNINADRIIIVCLDGERALIKKVVQQLDFSDRIQGIITVNQMNEWYSCCMSKKNRKKLGKQLLEDLRREFNLEFPSNKYLDQFLKERKYKSSKLKWNWKL